MFLVKEIKSKEGEVHFRRYQLLWTPWFTFYLHQILQPDKDKHLHDHPWDFWSLVLWGGYEEILDHRLTQDRKIGHFVYHKSTDLHKIGKIHGSAWTLVCIFGERRMWGYQTEHGWKDHVEYRKLKHEGVWE